MMPSNRREATQSDNPPTEVERVMESATTTVKPASCKRPNVIVVVPSMTTDRRGNCPVDAVFTFCRDKSGRVVSGGTGSYYSRTGRGGQYRGYDR